MGSAHPKQISLTRKNAYGKPRVTITETDVPYMDYFNAGVRDSTVSETCEIVPLVGSETDLLNCEDELDSIVESVRNDITFTATSTLRTFEFFEMSSVTDMFSRTSTVITSFEMAETNESKSEEVDSADDSGDANNEIVIETSQDWTYVLSQVDEKPGIRIILKNGSVWSGLLHEVDLDYEAYGCLVMNQARRLEATTFSDPLTRICFDLPDINHVHVFPPEQKYTAIHE